MNPTNFISAADAFHDWREELLTGSAPILYPIGEGELSRIEIGPGRVMLIGGAPGAGKTAFTMQAVVDALRVTPDVKALVCNVEMTPAVLLDRQLSRLSGIDLGTIRHRQFGEEHAERLRLGLDTLDDISERLAFARPPFNLDNVAGSVDAFKAGLIVLDYIQRIPPPGAHGDKRGAVDASMSFLRQFADAGMAVVVVAAVSRQKDSRGRSSYDGAALSLASFRESSELEFGADDAFILVPDGNYNVTLRYLKARHSDPVDIPLRFERRLQRFTAFNTATTSRSSTVNEGKVSETLAALWDRTDAADSETDGGAA